ncbi:GTP-binding protein [Pelomyxa schiedti]|nr:GTP-binding protein [Pelomyxa schiedti]
MSASTLRPKRVLVFGACGQGKTSLLNELLGTHMETSSGAVGCTFKTTTCEPHVPPGGGAPVVFIDTAGLNEADHGTVPGREAVKNLLEFLRSNREGFNLMVMVHRCGRLDSLFGNNYDLFVKGLVNNSVPVIFVTTGCENEENLDSWPRANNVGAMGWHFEDVVGTTFARSPNARVDAEFAKMRLESAQRVWNAVNVHARAAPVDFVTSGGGFKSIVRRVYNFISTIFNLPKWADGVLTALLIRLGFSSDEAVDLARKLGD